MSASSRYPLFVRRDVDGFFGLFIDNLVQLLLIAALCGQLCGMTGEFRYLIFARILPGAAVSILIGNLFYAWQARRLAFREGRDDVCALPYGINTPSLLVYVIFIMAPVYRQTGDPVSAWRMGLLACLGSGIIELAGSVVAERVRRATPRAALLSTLAGIAIGFISMTFAVQIWQYPLVALAPMGIILVTYFSKVRLPLGLPGGLLAVALGTALAWMLPARFTGLEVSASRVAEEWAHRGLFLPVFCGSDIWETCLSHYREGIGYLSVIVPMGLFNVIGSLQNIESAEAGGDRFATAPSLAVNGIGTIAAAMFGSCFPTTIYIGHPGWKALGARAGYSTLNGLVITVLALSGLVGMVSRLMPIEAGIAIVLWIGIIITAQAFQATPPAHAPAVAIGLFPAIAAWGATVVVGAFQTAGGKTLEQVLAYDLSASVSGFLLHGLNLLSTGFIFTSMILAALSAHLVDGRFFRAAKWALIAAAMTAVGLIHAYRLSGNVVAYNPIGGAAPAAEGGLAFGAGGIAVGYLLIAACLAGVGWHDARRRTDDRAP